MSRRAYLRFSVRFQDGDPETETWNCEIELDREAIDAIVKRAAGRNPPEWRMVMFHAMHALETALVGWASRALKHRVDSDADVLAIGLMNLENLRRRDPDT